jgi:hypothetical protein
MTRSVAQRAGTAAASRQMAHFRDGERFTGSVEGLVHESAVDEPALSALTYSLARERGGVGEEIARLIVAVGLSANSARPADGVLRDRRFVDILVKGAVAKPGPRREACLEAIRARVPPATIGDYADALVGTLEAWPSSTAFLIAAKGKLGDARQFVDASLRTSRWGKSESAQVASAALGNLALERRFVDPFLTAREPAEAVRLAYRVGAVGTEAALARLAGELRSGLVIDLGVLRRSVRLDIIAALRFNLPDVECLHERNIQNDEGYEAVERFAEDRFGIAWRTPRPPFLTVQGFAHFRRRAERRE